MERLDITADYLYSIPSFICSYCNICNDMADIRYSRHARLRMVERGISEKEVSEAIHKGRKMTKDGQIHAIYRHIEVALKKVGDESYVITVMLRW